MSKGLFTLSISVNDSMILAILPSLKTTESLQIEVATHFGATPLFSITAASLVSLQHCRSVDSEFMCKRPYPFSIFATLLTILMQTRKGNVFTRVCHSVHRGVSARHIPAQTRNTFVRPCSHLTDAFAFTLPQTS